MGVIHYQRNAELTGGGSYPRYIAHHSEIVGRGYINRFGVGIPAQRLPHRPRSYPAGKGVAGTAVREHPHRVYPQESHGVYGAAVYHPAADYPSSVRSNGSEHRLYAECAAARAHKSGFCAEQLSRQSLRLGCRPLAVKKTARVGNLGYIKALHDAERRERVGRALVRGHMH